MGRDDLHTAAFRGLALLMVLLAACNQRGSEQQASSKRFSGAMDDRYYVHPRVPGDGRLVIKGCCTFETAHTEVSQLLGDVDGRLVRGSGYQIEIAFGNRLAPLRPGFRSVGQRRVDGVNVIELKAGPNQYALQASVPLSDEAAKRGIDFPQLQVLGKCETADACRELERVLASIRF